MRPKVLIPALMAGAGLMLALAPNNPWRRLDAPPGSPFKEEPTRATEGATSNHPPDPGRRSDSRAGPSGGVASLTGWLDALAAETDPMQRHLELARFTDQIAEADLPGFLQWLLAQSNGQLREELARPLLRRWAQHNPAAATAWAGTLPEGPFRAALLEAAATVWAGRDVSAAAEWAGQLPQGAERAQVLGAVAAEAAREQPVLALRLVGQLPDDPTRVELLSHCLAQWTLLDSAAARAWADGLGEKSLRTAALVAVVTTLAGEDPLAAATLAARDLPPGLEQDRAVVAVLQRWAQGDPIAARTWLEAWPEGSLRDAAIEAIQPFAQAPRLPPSSVP